MNDRERLDLTVLSGVCRVACFGPGEDLRCSAVPGTLHLFWFIRHCIGDRGRAVAVYGYFLLCVCTPSLPLAPNDLPPFGTNKVPPLKDFFLALRSSALLCRKLHQSLVGIRFLGLNDKQSARRKENCARFWDAWVAGVSTDPLPQTGEAPICVLGRQQGTHSLPPP